MFRSVFAQRSIEENFYFKFSVLENEYARFFAAFFVMVFLRKRENEKRFLADKRDEGKRRIVR